MARRPPARARAATLLVIGFALHNATEGFGIVAPWPRHGENPTPVRRGRLCSCRRHRGGPTLSDRGRSCLHQRAVSVIFLTLAAARSSTSSAALPIAGRSTRKD